MTSGCPTSNDDDPRTPTPRRLHLQSADCHVLVFLAPGAVRLSKSIGGNHPPPAYRPPLGLGFEYSNFATQQNPQLPNQPPPNYSSLQNPGVSNQYPPLGGQPSSSTMIWSSNVVAPAPMSMNEPPPQDYTKRALFATLCCCFPIGLCALMNANASKKALARGDLNAARNSANSARTLSTVAFIVGIVTILGTAVVVGVYMYFILSITSTDDEY